MIEIILFMITISVVVILTLAEAMQDFWVIKYKNSREEKWKFWGNFYELGWITFYVLSVCYFTGFWTPLFWIPILWLIRTIFHNGFIAVMLDEKFTYIGDTGFDGKMKKMFQGSGAFFLVGEIFILAILILSYVNVKFNLDLWQMILNIFR